jgi:septal ring factor EnvC (AmiA/AmiB activator)
MNKIIMDKLAALEEQNTKLTTIVDVTSQKLTTYEAQNAALQAKILELTTRIAGIESGLNQVSQLTQGNKPYRVATREPSSSSVVSSPIKRSEPRITYTVQAIIPGRAWLKSEAGDTITVAEGDVLKSFGRVIKLDPYDGIVEVDTGSRVVTLTYGGGTS